MRYRAKATLFVGGSRIRAGQEFSSDDTPGTDWEPIDAGSKAPAVAKFVEQRVKTPETTAAPKPVEPPIDPWEKYTDDQIRAFIDTKGGKQPAATASRETLISRAKSLVGTDGAS